MINRAAINSKYVFLWSKYRPAILNLMISATSGPQQYQFSKHEFQDINPKKRTGYSFVLRVHRGKAANNIKTSVLAQDLLMVLQHSAKARELAEESLYEFELDRDFKLHIKQEEAPEVN